MAVAFANVYSALWSHLTGDSDFNTSLGGNAFTTGRVYYEQQVPDEPTLPYAVMSVVDNVWADAWDKQGYRARVQVTVWTDEDDGVVSPQTIIDELRARVHRVTFAVTGHDNMAAVIDITRGPLKEDDAFRMDADVLLRGFES